MYMSMSFRSPPRGDPRVSRRAPTATWASRLVAPVTARSTGCLGLDVLACLRCGGRLTLIALIEDPAVIVNSLRHLGLPTDILEAQPARAPPPPLVVDAPPTAVPDEQFLADGLGVDLEEWMPPHPHGDRDVRQE